MALFFITGISGSGKSTVAGELKSRGYEAYDTDDDGFARWRNKVTGYIHPKSSIKQEDRTKTFLRLNNWVVPRLAIEALANKAENSEIFLCGVAHNEAELNDLFKIVFQLRIDEKTLVHRLTTRTNNDWGKQPHELEKTIKGYRKNDKFQESNSFIIDATQPIGVVVDCILDKAKV